MSNSRDEKAEEHLKHLAADFLQRESNRTSLITVTNAKIANKLSRATIYLTVFPETNQDDALEFAKRKRTEFRQYVKDHSKIRKIPVFDFEIDFGEKNRQRIDEISNSEDKA